ncbi:hypothetical protein L5B97_01810 [Avibacterium sp. 20-15]|uniref:hypothetical protein n=1 Tax=unclassified Avibacterium TaxID=2685287 RepID=UPI0020264F00|nr:MULTISPECIES: hypothetical protein [unclassified Avibacterium]MCW9732231.1 hypothetical protein [Avibacterium sp. 20-15]URL04402.1 hypothetical protein L4F93_00505 [Avibacterium sp. 20-132]
MIFGNPGVYDENGDINFFALSIEKILNLDFFSINLILDMNIYPSHLAYNLRGYALDILDADNPIFHQENPYLFNLSEDELLVELIKNQSWYLYSIEALIRDNELDEFFTTKSLDILYNKMESFEYKRNENSCFWDMGIMEYRNIYPFIVNYNGYSKVIIISENINPKYPNESDYERFFDDNMNLKEISFFDRNYWGIEVKTIKTSELLKIVLDAHNYIKNNANS